MHVNNNHIIQRQVLEVEMENPADAFQFRNRLGTVFQEKILPGLEILFDEIGANNRLVRMDKLEIEVGNIEAKNWENNLAAKAIQQIRQALLMQNPAGRIQADDSKKNTELTTNNIAEIIHPKEELKEADFMDAFFFFLKTGMFPWYASKQSALSELLKISLTNEAASKFRERLILLDTVEITRLIYQFDEQVLNQLIKYSLPQQKASFYNKFIEAINFMKTNLMPAYKNTSTLKKVNELIAGPVLLPIIKKNETLKDNQNENIKEALYIENAGLLLLHTFLQPFFKEIQLTKDDLFTDEYNRMKAVLFTQYFVYGTTHFEEPTLILNKILCGYPIHEPIIRELEIITQEKAAATDLLQQVIQRWLKNNVQVNGTIEGFQQSFLLRPGKLLQKDNNWHLQVEQKPYDMLLSSLPWGIGIIKTPWMNGMLWVDWA